MSEDFRSDASQPHMDSFEKLRILANRIGCGIFLLLMIGGCALFYHACNSKPCETLNYDCTQEQYRRR